MKYFIIFEILFFAFSTSHGQTRWPVQPFNQQHSVVGSIGECRESNLHYHMGIDITNGSDYNVYSIEAGTVTNVHYTGNCWTSYIDVTNVNGIRIRYFHIKTVSNQIQTGVTVVQSQLIGQMFSAGGCNLHVHIEKPNGNFLDSELAAFVDNSDPIIGTTTFCLNGATFYANRDALSTKFNVNNEDYLLLYSKIDIISSAHDTRLSSIGAADGGYLAPFSIEYEIFNNNNQSVNEPVQNFNFSDPPPNDNVQYAFSYGSILTNFSYILTNDPDPLESEPPDKYFNTILQKNTPETWPNNSSLDAHFNGDAFYSDGIYNIVVRVTDVDNGHNPRHTATSTSKIIIDNFRPYISRVKIYEGSSSDWVLKYNRGWQWANNTLQFEPQPNTAYFNQTKNIKVTITTSEPMLNVTLNVGNLMPQTIQCGTDLNKTIWEFTVPIANTNAGEKQLTISGHDLANNPIQSKPNIIPVRQSNTTWIPAPNTTSEDTYHKIIYGGNGIDFIALQKGNDYNLIEFTDKSSGYVQGSSWGFGDNMPDGYGNVVTHNYASYGIYNVTHNAIANGTQGSFSKPVSVNELIAPKVITTTANPIFPLGGGKNSMTTIDVDFYSDCEGIISNYTWQIAGNTYNTQHPTGISLIENTEYFVTLTVENAAGTDTYTKRFYFDRFSTPYCTILDWEVTYFVHDLEVSTANFKENEPLLFTIEYGDGITETYLENSYSYHTFTHNYYELGEYIAIVTVTGKDAQNKDIEVSTAKRIRVQPYDLELSLNISSTHIPPVAKEKIVCQATVTNGSSGVTYSGSWGVYRVGDPNSYHAELFQSVAQITDFVYIPNQAGQYKIMLDVYVDELATSGYAGQYIEVVNAPKYVDANISSDSYQLSLNSEYTLYGSVWPTGDPGVAEQDWNPTNIRWTLKGPQTNIVENLTFPFDEYYFTRFFTHKFVHEGNYTLQLETWNNQHDYTQNNELDTSNNCRLSFYNYDIKQIEVKAEIPSLAITSPAVTYYQPLAITPPLIIKIMNPSNEPITWTAELSHGYEQATWIHIVDMSGNNLCCNIEQNVTVNIAENPDIDNRFGLIRITGKDSNGNNVQGSPAYIQVDQYGTDGPYQEIVKGVSPDVNFGYAVSIDGGIAIIGSPNTAWDIGQAYIYRKTSIGNWIKISTLKSSDNNADFGNYVDISGDYACVLGSDKVYFYERGNSDWNGVATELKSYIVSAPRSVSIWGDYAVVGSPLYDNDRGKITIFYRNQGGVGNWGIVKEILGENGGGKFGNSIDLYNDKLVVGAPNAGQGYMEIFDRNLTSSNDWGMEQKILAPEYSYGESGTSEFGKAVTIFENKVATTYYRYIEAGSSPYMFFSPAIYSILYRESIDGGWIEIGRYAKQDRPAGNNVTSATMFKSKYPIGNEGFYLAGFGMPVSQYFLADGTDGSFGSELVLKENDMDNTVGSYYDNLWQQTLYTPNQDERYGNSAAYSFTAHLIGIPGYDNPIDHNNYGGALFDNNYMLGKNLCEACIDLSFINFSKPSGNYSDVIARNISLGGREFPATIENGAIISYKANEILLQDGFLSENGSVFTAEAQDCSGSSDSPHKLQNKEIDMQEWPLSPEARRTLLKTYMRAFPDLPWQIYDITNASDFEKSKMGYSDQSVGNGLANLPSGLKGQEMPNLPILILNDGKIKLKIGGSSKTCCN
jgi:hypothetical protein